jgi:class 3 adenylate cyclase
VALLFTDIEGSTRLAQAHPATFSASLRAVTIRCFATGSDRDRWPASPDALFIAFDSVTDALQAAAEGQRRLTSERWPDDARVRVRVRMGVHVGQAEAAWDTYLGVEVHRAARICAAAHGGQVLVSHAAATIDAAPAGLCRGANRRFRRTSGAQQ